MTQFCSFLWLSNAAAWVPVKPCLNFLSDLFSVSDDPLQYSWVSFVAQLVKNLPAIWETWVWSLGCGKIPWRMERLLTPVFWPGEFHGRYTPWGLKESDMTEWFSHKDFSDCYTEKGLEGGSVCQRVDSRSFSFTKNLWKCTFLDPWIRNSRVGSPATWVLM